MNQYTYHRQRANEVSRGVARRNREPWSDEDHALLDTWAGTEPMLVEIASTLGRTIEACRVRFYLRHPCVRQPAAEKPVPEHVNGWLVGLCSGCGRITDVFCTGLTQECEDCR